MSADARPSPRGPLGWAMLTAALAVVAARQLFPSVDADAGSGALFVLVAWGVGALAAADLFLRRGPSAPVPAFIFLVALSTATAAYKYPALHLLGEWIGVLCVWAALRRAASPTAIKLAALLVVVLALGESLLTWHQVRTVIPELLERYHRGDVGIMRDLAQAGVAPGFMFQARLEARLPWGTFGHTNTLAGFLLLGVPFLFVTSAAAWSATPTRKTWLARLLAAALLALLLSALALTKGRSAWVGAAASLAVVALASPPVRDRIRRRWPWAAAGALVVIGLFLWKAGNAAESLRYRFEYWRGTGPIIRDHPWLGVGWGAFRDHYLEHKLPESSEEVADPHNFLLEVAACAGIPAALAYLWWLAATLHGLLRRPDRGEQDASPPALDVLTLGASLLLAGGAVLLLGFSSAWSEIGGWGILAAFAAVATWDRLAPPVSAGSWRVAAAAAIIGLHVHLLAAGGVGHPGTMLAGWALAAVAGPSAPAGRAQRWRDLGLLLGLLMVGAALGCPDLAKRTVKRDPILGRIRNDGRFLTEEAAARLYDRALALTPGDGDLWAEVARWRRARMGESGGDAAANYQQALTAIDRALELQPLRSNFWHERGMLQLEAAGRGVISTEATGEAAGDLHRAVQRYPNSPARQADEAFVLAAVGQEPRTPTGLRIALEEWRTVKNPSTPADVGERLGGAAGRGIGNRTGRGVQAAAERALQLDAATPHFDKKLLPAERAWLRAIVDELRRRGTDE